MTPYSMDDFRWAERIRESMRGYWISPSGKLSVTYHVPSLWERIVEGFHGYSWKRLPSPSTREERKRGASTNNGRRGNREVANVANSEGLKPNAPHDHQAREMK